MKKKRKEKQITPAVMLVVMERKRNQKAYLPVAAGNKHENYDRTKKCSQRKCVLCLAIFQDTSASLNSPSLYASFR